MKAFTKYEAFEEKLRQMAEGFRGIPSTQLIFNGEGMLSMQAAQKAQGILDEFQGVRDAEGAHTLAVANLEQAMPHHTAFYDEAVSVVRSHFGTDPGRLARFGLEVRKAPKHRRRPRVEREVIRSTVVEEVTIGPGRRPEVKVLDTDTEVIEESVEPGRHRRPEHRRDARRSASMPGTSPVVAPPAVIPPAATSSKRGKAR